MIRIYFGSQGSGKSFKAKQNLSCACKDLAIYSVTSGSLRMWRNLNPDISEILLPSTESVVLLHNNIFELQDRSAKLFPCLLTLDESCNVELLIEKYDDSLYRLFKAASVIYYFASGLGALSDVPEEFKPTGDDILTICNFNQYFDKHPYYEFKKGNTMREGYVPFNSEESESIRQELIEEVDKREEEKTPERMSLEPSLSSEDKAALVYLLRILPECYKKAQFKMRKKKNYYDSTLTDYEFDLRYDTKDGQFIDTFRISCVKHQKV